MLILQFASPINIINYNQLPMSFNKLGLNPMMTKICQKIQYHTPTPIQKLAIPSVLKGQSIIANAQTGSGKTAAFGLPIIHQLSRDPFSVYALIITPSRELAMQIYQQMSIFGQSMNLRQALLIGGVPFGKQIDQLQAYPHVVVGTPGRINHMLQKCQKFREDIERLEFLVLDEADRLFQQSLMDDMQSILRLTTDVKQIILATATIDENFEGKKLQQVLNTQKNFIKHSTYQGIKTVSSACLTQNYIFTPQELKPSYLLALLQDNHTTKTIVFVKTCKEATIISETLKALGFKAVSLHSFMKFNQRVANLAIFRSDQANILITTDLTSRGLDINNVSLVINYHMPRKVSDYVHRVGRTARNGYEGQAISFVTQYEQDLFLQIEQQINVKIGQLGMKQNLQLLSKYNKAKREVKMELMSSGVLTEIDKKSDSKKQRKMQIKRIRQQKLEQKAH